MRIQTFNHPSPFPGMLAVVLLSGFVFVAGVEAQVTYQVRTNYYAVTGGSLEDIHRSLRQTRPWRGTSNSDGKTDWRIDYRIQTAATGNWCRLSSVKVRAAITITLPTLQVPPDTPKEVMVAWQKYLGKLMAHEQKHADIARVSAEEMLRRIRAVGADRNYGALKARVYRVAGQVKKECFTRHADYDRRTRHGETEGVVLPRVRRRSPENR